MSIDDTTVAHKGNLTADPELRFTKTGLAVATFTVASNRRVFNKQTSQWEDGDTLFLRCTVWRDMAEHAAESLRRGMRVIVTGRLKQTSFEDKEGQKRTFVELDADDVGPSLRRATAKVEKTERIKTAAEQAPHPAASTDDLWATPQETTPATASATASGGHQDGNDPPF